MVGIDLDPVLIEVALSDHPDAEWYVGDLADLDHCAGLADQVFDLEVSAGNVITFVAPGLRRAALGQLRDRLAPDGRLVIGFGTDRGYRVDDFFDDLDAVGLQRELLLSTWDLRPWTGTEGSWLPFCAEPDGLGPVLSAGFIGKRGRFASGWADATHHPDGTVRPLGNYGHGRMYGTCAAGGDGAAVDRARGHTGRGPKC